jgi:hypothetical protein
MLLPPLEDGQLATCLVRLLMLLDRLLPPQEDEQLTTGLISP